MNHLLHLLATPLPPDDNMSIMEAMGSGGETRLRQISLSTSIDRYKLDATLMRGLAYRCSLLTKNIPSSQVGDHGLSALYFLRMRLTPFA